MRQLVTSLVLSRIDYLRRSPRPTCVDHCSTPACAEWWDVRLVLRLGQCAVGRTFLQISVNFTGHQWSTESSSKSPCLCTKSPLNDVRRTLPTLSPSARRTLSGDLFARHRPVQPSSDENVLILDDVRSLSACGLDVWNSLPSSL